MVARVENIVADDGSPRVRPTQDSSFKMKGQETNDGERVYRRRIRSLKDLPVEAPISPNCVEEQGVGRQSSVMAPNYLKGSGHDFAINGVTSTSMLKPKRFPAGGSNHLGPSRFEASLVEVRPKLGQVSGQLSEQLHRTITAKPIQERRICQVMNGSVLDPRMSSRTAAVPVSQMPSRAAAGDVGGHGGRHGKLTKPSKPIAGQRQSTLEQFYSDPAPTTEKVRPKSKQRALIANSGVDVDSRSLELSKHPGKPPSKPKRKKEIAGLDESKCPPKGNIFPPVPSIFSPVPADDDFLPWKRRKIGNKEVRDGSAPVKKSASVRVLIEKKNEVRVSEGEKQQDAQVPVPSSRASKRRRGSVQASGILENGFVNGPLKALEKPGRSSSNSGAGHVPVQKHSEVPIVNNVDAPVDVPVEAFRLPRSKPFHINIAVEAVASSQSRNVDPVSIPVGELGIPHSNRGLVTVAVEAVGGRRPQSDVVGLVGQQDEKSRCLEELTMPIPQAVSIGIKTKKKLPGIKKDGTPDGRCKKEGSISAARRMKDPMGKHSMMPVDKQQQAPSVEVVHAKKLPEVQKNGVRKPKRVQLKRFFLEKQDVAPQVPTPKATTANSRVVKTLWSPPKLMERIADGSREHGAVPPPPPRQVKSTKFLSLQQLDASEKRNKLRTQRPSLDLREVENSASDQTVSNCAPESKRQFGEDGQTTTTASEGVEGQEDGKAEPDVSESLKTRPNGRRHYAVTTTKRRLAKAKLKLANGGLNGVFDMTLRTREQSITTQQTVDTANGHLEAANKVVEVSQKKRERRALAQQAEEMANCVFDGTTGDLELSPSSSMRSPSPEPLAGIDCDGMNGVPRMTPRARKLTDAMQNFLHQKATLLRQWKEMELGKLHPMALIGRSCKIFWPLDSEWYPGVIHEYNPQTRRHRIDYEDDEREWVSLGKERVKLHVSAEESKILEMSFGEGSPLDQGKKLDADELAVLAAGQQGCHGELSHGDLVWAKVKGYPMWPACVMDEEHASAGGLEPSPRERTVPVQFFGSYDHARINSKKVVPFAKGITHKYHSKCKRTVFEQGLQEIERYLKECKLPDQMAQLQEDVVVVLDRRKTEDLTSNDESDEDEDSNSVWKKTPETSCTFPLDLGALSVLTLGVIVKDSEHFHTENHIWTEGYTAIRKFASMKDPEKIVEYKMEVLRNPLMPLFPLFRVTPEDDKSVEAPNASGCWKRILIKVQRAKEKAGLCIATLLEKKRQSFRSGPSMFGLTNRKVSRLIQALPNAIVCSKFTAWIEKPLVDDGSEELTPAGYQPVDIPWKHLDRCNICYLDEEYTDNQLLQCDKCRTMVHMRCYGELEPPDGDLWLCNLCRPDAPKRSPFCCLCPVTGGARKPTTDGRWAHLTCAMWTPETCLVDVKRMEPVDGINSINKDRWKLVCSVCKVPYGACIQCSKFNCRVAFHPLCARGAGLSMEVLEDKAAMVADAEAGLQLLTYCKKHSHSMSSGVTVRPQSQQTVKISQTARPAAGPPIPLPPKRNISGCARSEPYNAASRRGHRQPEALAAALSKRFFVENKPYFVTGCQRNVPNRELKSLGGSLWSRHWKQPKPVAASSGDGAAIEEEGGGDGEKAPQSTSERYRHMRSTMHERLTFGKSSIHGWGVFTKRPHSVGDMVIEYAGEIVRPSIADIRERRSYDSLVGAGTYMFRIDDERVVDATHAGSIAHLINHSCEPNCYSRVVAASGDDHIIIFAKRDIREGEELTYDYRFASKDELLTCYCGCAGCRGFVNTFDLEDDPTRIVAPRSELTRWVVS